MSLQLSLHGRCADRWLVRIEIDPDRQPRALTVALVTEAGRHLGPAAVVPLGGGSPLHAELRGPAVLPPGTRIVATADMADGTSDRLESVVDARRGLHAFLHADGRLPLDSEPTGAALTRAEVARLARRFPWAAGCCADPVELGDDVIAMLRSEFDVDPDDLTEELLKALRR